MPNNDDDDDVSFGVLSVTSFSHFYGIVNSWFFTSSFNPFF